MNIEDFVGHDPRNTAFVAEQQDRLRTRTDFQDTLWIPRYANTKPGPRQSKPSSACTNREGQDEHTETLHASNRGWKNQV